MQSFLVARIVLFNNETILATRQEFPDGYFPERTFPRMKDTKNSSLNDTSPNGHLPASHISFQE